MNCNWLLVLLLPSFALAGGVRQDVDQSIGDTVVNAGDTSIGGNDTKAYAFSHGLGDVDIADCLASVQWGTILFSTQGVKLNKWCAAEIYDAKGLYHMAALMRCDIKEVAQHFATQDKCIEANTVTAASHNPAQTDDCDDDCEDQLEQVVVLEERLAALEKLRQEDATRARYAAREARQAKEAANQLGISEEQREALAEVFKK